MLLEKYINDIVKNELQNFGFQDFDKYDNEKLLLGLLHLKLKVINPERYTIKESKEFLKRISTIDSKFQYAYKIIKERLLNGYDINPFLSKQAIEPHKKDSLLFHWNISHLHLNANKSNGYFNKRSGQLAFVHFDRHQKIAYFIDIQHHSKRNVFARKKYLEILQKNFPEVMELWECKGIQDVSIAPNDDDIKSLIKNDITLILKVNDKFYMPPGLGTALDGSSTRAVMEMNRVLRHLQEWEKCIPQIASNINCKIKDINIGFAYNAQNKVVVVEENKKILLGEFF